MYQSVRIGGVVIALATLLLHASCALAQSAEVNAVSSSVCTDSSDNSDLKFALVFSRHGIRSPTKPVEAYAKYARDPWPTWDVPPGDLTSHGWKQMVVMGKYYRDYFADQGLLTGNAKDDAAHVYIYADTEQRTMQTGAALAEGLAELPPSAVNHINDDEADTLFHSAGGVGQPLSDLALAAVNGRIGDDPLTLEQRGALAFDLLNSVLEQSIDVGPDTITTGHGGNLVKIAGPLSTASTLAEIFVLEYANGMQPGWGRLTKKQIGEIDELHTLYFDLKDRTMPLAQAQASNQLLHICNTILLHAPASLPSHDPSAVSSGSQIPEASGVYGDVNDKVVVLVGHDDQMSSLGGLLHADWQVRDFAYDDPSPGSAMVFELRHLHNSDVNSPGSYFVRVYFIGQSLDQMRNLTPLAPASARSNTSSAESPSVSPMFIPGASTGDCWCDCPLDAFERVVDSAIDRHYTSPQ